MVAVKTTDRMFPTPGPHTLPGETIFRYVADVGQKGRDRIQKHMTATGYAVRDSMKYEDGTSWEIWGPKDKGPRTRKPTGDRARVTEALKVLADVEKSEKGRFRPQTAPVLERVSHTGIQGGWHYRTTNGHVAVELSVHLDDGLEELVPPTDPEKGQSMRAEGFERITPSKGPHKFILPLNELRDALKQLKPLTVGLRAVELAGTEWDHEVRLRVSSSQHGETTLGLPRSVYVRSNTGPIVAFGLQWKYLAMLERLARAVGLREVTLHVESADDKVRCDGDREGVGFVFIVMPVHLS